MPASHGGGDAAPEPDSTAGAAAAGTTPTMTEPNTEAASSWTQSGAAVAWTTAADASMTSDDDGDALKVVTGHPRL
jgi:hypothetical protein